MKQKQILELFCLAVLVGVALPAGAPAAAAEDFTLRLAEFAFDPLQAEPELPAGWDRSSSATADLHLVQFDGPIEGGTLDRLRDGGVEPVQYIYPNTYIVWGRGEDRAALLGARSVRWTGDFAPAYRVQPQWRERVGEQLYVAALIYRGADTDGVVEALIALGGKLERRRVISEKFELVGMILPGQRMREAASIPGVYTIQQRAGHWGSRAEYSAQINAGNLDALDYAIPGYQTWLAGLGLDGGGVIVANVDEGFDETHPDFAARVLPCTGPTCTDPASIATEHGTHTAGIIAGDGTTGVMDSFGFLRGLGVAPGANLIDQEYFPTAQQPGGMLDLMTDSSRSGALLSNNSWGSGDQSRGYDLESLLVDSGVRDSDPSQPGYQPLTYVQAINNGFGGTSSQGSPDEAKNIFTIGSTKALAANGTQDNHPNDLSSNTAHGPALDGRTIPHMVAPGAWVDSTYPDLGAGPQHHWLRGTSMAAPQVSGAVALFIEYYRGLPGYIADPSPALIKAAFLPVAHDLEGNLDANGGTLGHRPDSKQGWGRLNLPAVIDPPAGSVLYWDQRRIFEESHKEWLREVMPVDPAQPMRIMLVWTDAPGHGLGGSLPAWNNDLNLIVEVGADTYYGNNFGPDGYSATGGAPEAMNNAEGVFFELPPTSATVRVVAENINSDGVPGYNDETDQDFALVCYNCAYVSGFALIPDPVTYYVCAPDEAPFNIEVEQHQGYTEPVTLTVDKSPLGASTSFDVNPVAPGGSTLLTVDPGSAVPGNHELEISGNSVDLTRPHPLYLRLRTAVPDPALLTLPLDAAVDVFPRPVLEWDPVDWAYEYVVEVARDAAFADIFYTARTSGTAHTVRETLDRGAVWYWRVRASNVCGFGGFSPVFSFTTEGAAPVLLVDDDYYQPGIYGEFQSDYTGALDALGVSYDVWDVFELMGLKEPDYSTLALYERVIWWSGDNDNNAGPSEYSEGQLRKWFERRSGCLFLTSADYDYARNANSDFISGELGAESVTGDTAQNNVTPDPDGVFAALGIDPLSLGNANPDYSDSITPDATALVAFAGDMGTAGITKDGGFYRTTYLGYEAARHNSGDLENVLNTFLGWCDGMSAVDGDSDGVENGTDCAPGDVNAWTAPGEITDFGLGKVEGEAFSWSEPVSGGGAVYDVLRTEDYTDFWNATCVASGVDGPPPWLDDDPQQPGEIFFYQVRTRGECGMSTLGYFPGGAPRQGRACE